MNSRIDGVSDSLESNAHRIAEALDHRSRQINQTLIERTREIAETFTVGQSEFAAVIDGSLKGWLSVMEDLRKVDAVRVIPGHGPTSAAWPEALADQERYLRIGREEVRAVIARGGTMEEAVATVGRSEADKWLLFDNYHARNVVTAFAELEWE